MEGGGEEFDDWRWVLACDRVFFAHGVLIVGKT